MIGIKIVSLERGKGIMIISIILFAVVIAESVLYRYRYKQVLDGYNPITKFFAGTGGIIALAGIISCIMEIEGATIMLITGLVISFLVCIPAMNFYGRDYRILLSRGYSETKLKSIHPVSIWKAHVLGGMGFIFTVALSLTVVGLIPLRIMKNSIVMTDYLNEQQKLKIEAERIRSAGY